MLTSAHAQQAPLPDGAVAGSPVGVSVVLPPPAGFDPVTASPVARQQYEVPPEPDAVAAPAAHAIWAKAMSGFANRVAPTLTPTNVFNGPNQRIGGTAPYVDSNGAASNNVVTGASSNWSGTSIVNSKKPFTIEAIIGRFIVPTAHVAFGTCTGVTDWASVWPGIDGNGSSDLLQAGIQALARCSGGTTSTSYSAWIEWIPNAETLVSAPAVHPGDEMSIEVWNTTGFIGYAYFYDYSTEQSAEYKLTSPNQTALQGNSLEWIVERTEVGGSLATLTNYIDVAWPYGIAWNYGAKSPTYYYQATNPSAGTLEYITMLDNNGKGISAPTIENGDFVWDQNYGSSCGRTGAPPC
jgi:hypothetical protein